MPPCQACLWERRLQDRPQPQFLQRTCLQSLVRRLSLLLQVLLEHCTQLDRGERFNVVICAPLFHPPLSEYPQPLFLYRTRLGTPTGKNLLQKPKSKDPQLHHFLPCTRNQWLVGQSPLTQCTRPLQQRSNSWTRSRP